MNYKFVFDTNSIISAALFRNSVSGRALRHALTIGRFVISEPTLQELEQVIFRKKFDKYFLNDQERLDIINLVESNALYYSPTTVIAVCRDPKDNMFLELATSAKVNCIVTGDQDLLVLNPFENIPIVSAIEFLIAFS